MQKTGWTNYASFLVWKRVSPIYAITRVQSTTIIVCMRHFSAWWNPTERTNNQAILEQTSSWPVKKAIFCNCCPYKSGDIAKNFYSVSQLVLWEPRRHLLRCLTCQRASHQSLLWGKIIALSSQESTVNVHDRKSKLSVIPCDTSHKCRSLHIIVEEHNCLYMGWVLTLSCVRRSEEVIWPSPTLSVDRCQAN